jgi:hypothetical protein
MFRCLLHSSHLPGGREIALCTLFLCVALALCLLDSFSATVMGRDDFPPLRAALSEDGENGYESFCVPYRCTVHGVARAGRGHCH